MNETDIAERVEKLLPCLFPDEFKSKLNSADKQTIKDLEMLHKNPNFQKVFEGCRTRSQTHKILRVVELAFETDLVNDVNQNRDVSDPKLDISKLEDNSNDICYSENKGTQ